ncbi:hypothetical protein ATCVMO0605SPH_856L [Acanthocystis turfacea Chlorella virus MO0605SPH]|jgi:hypothetical protein|uniref:Uncharacterized protein Z767L n=1 Tax=Chlorovirus heliozoae TaxID=322019 RepID=A7KA27_9PHYC|nr:hypothetical protein ATCV1_Z767L [Acanthocystis turfacea chlorella virus 1]ABT16901.1 hypothetical protein ATCV1_Z767L [Acanthocystis turfacea chlorella virus 1]AGE56116.1 hypothetical protein ATCVMO0605SPH_856L [Acanthocystis turfacea Chlorella virus MO0605SPH]AGE60237.1 hypothetical protein ATCVWI0606_872L [Acanthocystis turfacea Chlorella virus WI0606]
MTTITYENPLLPPPQLVLPDINEVLTPMKDPNANDLFLDMPYVPVPKAIDNVGSFQLNNLATARDVKTLQDKVNKNAEKMYAQSTVRGLTLRNGVEDVREALVGIWGDLYKNNLNVSVGTLFTKNNRLRGLGIFFILCAIVYFMFITVG